MPISRFHCYLQSSDLGDERLSPRGKRPPWGHPGQWGSTGASRPTASQRGTAHLWAANPVATDEPDELGSSTQPALSPSCPKCASCRDVHCK